MVGQQDAGMNWRAIKVIAVMCSGLAAGCAVTAAPAATGHLTKAAARAGAPFVYVTGKGGTNVVAQYASLASGALRPLTPRNVVAGEFPYDIVISPQGTSAYAVDSVSHTTGAVSQYTLNPATGKLTPKSPRTVATAGVPSGLIAISPDGKNAYVPSGKAISQYRISPVTGKLTPMPPRKVAGAGFPVGIKVAPDGRYLYFVSDKNCLVLKGSKGSQGSGCTGLAKASTVSVFRIGRSTGALSAEPVQTMRTGLGPQMIAIAPDGKSAYVAATGANTIWQYSINRATGRLTPMSPAKVTTGKGPHDLTVAPDGKNLYVITVDDATIAQYAISPRTGTLSAEPVSTARTVPAPEAIALSPGGKNAYVTSEGSGVLSQFALSPVTGKITALSPATVTAPSHGSLGVAVAP
jgi:6-phosphogluconolactonase (cycloisomerase 2 family)